MRRTHSCAVRHVSTAGFQTLIFLLNFGLTCTAVRWVAPSFPAIPQVSEKLAALSAGAPAYDAIFLGSSKINSGLIPPLFDQTLAARGIALHSFNLGIDGMGFPESAYLCEEAMRRTRGTIRWVFIELAGIRITLDAQNRQARRTLYWHDLPRTLLVCRRAFAALGEDSVLPPEEKRALLAAHLGLGARHFVNLAGGAGWLELRLQPQPPSLDPAPLDLAQAGFIPLRRQMPPEQIAKYQDSLAHFPTQRIPGDTVSDDALRALAQRLARLGATAIFIVPPNPVPGRRFREDRAPGAPPVLGCDDPAAFPGLYETQVRADEVHLNELGAHRFTTTLAGLFANFLEKHPPAR